MTAKQLLARDPGLLSEAEFSSLVADVARLAGFKAYHTFTSRRSQSGYPDWTFVKDGRLIFVELKTEVGKVRPDQAEWLDALSDVPGVEVYLWRPSDWTEIVNVLTGRRPRDVVDLTVAPARATSGRPAAPEGGEHARPAAR